MLGIWWIDLAVRVFRKHLCEWDHDDASIGLGIHRTDHGHTLLRVGPLAFHQCDVAVSKGGGQDVEIATVMVIECHEMRAPKKDCRWLKFNLRQYKGE